MIETMDIITDKNYKAGKPSPGITAVFWLLAAAFLATVIYFAVPMVTKYVGFLYVAICGSILFLLGVVLIILTIRQKIKGLLRKMLLLTGASSVGILVSVLLHNVFYGLFIRFFGVDFWDRIGITDEPFFFFMAFVICPLGFIVGTVVSIILFIKRK